MGYLERRIKNNVTDRQKLIHTYISIIKDHNRDIDISYSEFVKLIKINFGFTTTISEIEAYFEPNGSEYELDMRMQMDNLGIRYE